MDLGLNFISDRNLACELGVQSLPDGVDLTNWGFSPTSITEDFFLFPIHPVIGAKCGVVSVINSHVTHLAYRPLLGLVFFESAILNDFKDSVPSET